MNRKLEDSDRITVETEDTIAVTAADWLARRDRGLSRQEAAALAEWEAADPRHAAKLARMSGSWQQLDRLDRVSRLTASAEVIMIRAQRRRHRRRVFLATSGVLAAAAAVAVAYLGWWRESEISRPAPVESVMPASYQVLASTARHQSLPDGSVAELNGDALIETDFTAGERRVRLVRGEAHFSVAKNPARPFVVAAGPVSVRAVGTAFNVRQQSAAVDVLVTEGSIRLEGLAAESTARETDADHPALASGQHATVDTSRGVAKLVAIDHPTALERDELLAWRTTRIVFNGTPLDEVVSVFNRYNTRQLELGHPALRARTLTGMIRADNLDGFLALLETSIDVTSAGSTDNRIVLLPAR